jgi:hypothetical protein
MLSRATVIALVCLTVAKLSFYGTERAVKWANGPAAAAEIKKTDRLR